MVNKEKLKKQIEKTSNAIKDGVKKVGGKGRHKGVVAHKHCRICHLPIDIKRDPEICGNDECDKKWLQNKKNEKMVRIAFFFFALVFFAPLILVRLGVFD